jgi:hypothetical protein
MNFEYRTRDWEMWLEGTSERKPSQINIIKDAQNKGYKLKNIEIWFDSIQCFWRFSADLIN